MSKVTYSAIHIIKIDLENNILSHNGQAFVNLDDLLRYLTGKDLSLYAIFKDKRHIQIPLVPHSTEELKRIIIQS